MHPRLFDLVHSYTLFLGLAVVVGTAVAFFSASRVGLPWGRFAILLVLLGVTALGGAKLHSVLERGELGPIAWELGNGYRYPGGIVAWLVAVYLLPRVLLKRVGFFDLADVLAPSFAFATATTRIGCFLEGCCSGAVCRLPWAFSFPAHSYAWQTQVGAGIIPDSATASLPVHPLQLYFFLVSLSLGLLMFRLQSRKSFSGQVIVLFVALDNTAKLLLESLRDPHEPHLQLASLLLAAGSVSLLLTLSLRTATRSSAKARGCR